MSKLFISDLHLTEDRPQITELLLRFLAGPARHAEQLYILGDLFEAWVGDDHVSSLAVSVADALARLAGTGVECFFVHGNRDFLLGEAYAQRAGLRLLPDPTRIRLAAEPALIAHGDAQCIDDVPYQAFREQVRDPRWQQEFLAQPLSERLEFARQARDGSQRHTAQAAPEIMDVNPTAIDQLMVEHGVGLLIHGHTHRPAIHEFKLSNGRAACRVVLGDWYQRGSVLHWDVAGPRLELLES